MGDNERGDSVISGIGFSEALLMRYRSDNNPTDRDGSQAPVSSSDKNSTIERKIS